MLGVVIEKLGQLRKYGYRFIENEEGDFMRVEYGSNIIQTVSLTPQGKKVNFIVKKGKNRMEKVEPRTLAGFMELLPNEQILFNQMKEKIEKTYKKFGFLPLDTPVIELAEVLLAKAGGETEKQIFAPTTFGLADEEYLARIRSIAEGGCAMIIVGDVQIHSRSAAEKNHPGPAAGKIECRSGTVHYQYVSAEDP